MPDQKWSQLTNDTAAEEDYLLLASDISVPVSRSLSVEDLWASMRTLTPEVSVLDDMMLLLQRGINNSEKVSVANLRSLFTSSVNVNPHVGWSYLAPDNALFTRGFAARGTTSGTLSFIAPDATLPFLGRFTGTGGLFNWKQVCNIATAMGYSRWFVRTPTLTNARIFIGTSGQATPITDGDTQPTNNGYLFRFSTSVPDTNWQAITVVNGAGINVIDTGVPPSTTAVMKFELAWIRGTVCQFFIDDVLVATSTTFVTPPTGVTTMSQFAGMLPITGANSTFDIGMMYTIFAWP